MDRELLKTLIIFIILIVIKRYGFTIMGFRKVVKSYVDVTSNEKGRILLTVNKKGLGKFNKKKTYELKYIKIKKDIEEGYASVDEVDYPNEYTMWHSSWYKHNYIFLQPFYSYDGALLRLSYLISELVDDNIISDDSIETDPEIHQYPVKFI